MASRRTTKTRYMIDEPTMSDRTLLVSVEDLINIAMGPAEKNIVNYKMIQTVLHILARQLRMLERQVEIRVSEPPPVPEPKKPKTSPRPDKRQSIKPKEDKAGKQEIVKTDKVQASDKERIDQATDKDTRERGKEEKEIVAGKDQEREKISEGKERDKADKTASKQRDKEEKAAFKGKEKEEKAAIKEKEKAEQVLAKDKEKTEKAAAKDKEREAKDREKDEKRSAKEREKEERQALKDKGKSDREASKDREREERHALKEKNRDEKERDKAEKATSKEREKEERVREKETRGESKERDKANRAASKERDKEEKAVAKAEKEKDRADTAVGKARAKFDKQAEELEKERKRTPAKGQQGRVKEESPRGRGKGERLLPSSSESSIAISEKVKGKDKVLVVEKGPTTYADSRTRIGSIEVVTRSEFSLLESAVKDLMKKAAPLPMPSLPDNEKLRSDLAKGNASLTDMMQAMQVTARVHAAEDAITRMADILTQLAATGALPEDVASKIESGLQESMNAVRNLQAPTTGAGTEVGAEVEKADIRSIMASRKSVAIEAGVLREGHKLSLATGASLSSRIASRASSVGRLSMASTTFGGPCVSHKDMDECLQLLREELAKNTQQMTIRATNAAEAASNLSRMVAEKIDIALKLDSRINTLYSMTSDYAEQLCGFDSGLTTQMQSFQEQMAQMRSDLNSGLAVLETANNNAETAAVMELTERYEALVSELDRTTHAHSSLITLQKQIGDELKSLVECVEMLREQKADRDEVLDGLRDKADISRLTGLLRDEDFTRARLELERRLELCYDKFRKQDSVWMNALKDLSHITESKADIMDLLSVRERAQDYLNQIDEQVRRLALILGEPKAAILTRKLARDATCGACMVPALMEPAEPTYAEPAALPPLTFLRPHLLADEELCLIKTTPDAKLKQHACKRWAGGSHTLLQGAARQQAPPPPPAPSARRYVGVGDDGQLYMMEEPLQPCAECNQILADQIADLEEAVQDLPSRVLETGAGDQGFKSTVNIDEPEQ